MRASRVFACAVLAVSTLVFLSACGKVRPSLTRPAGDLHVHDEATVVGGSAKGAVPQTIERENVLYVFHPGYNRWLIAEKEGDVYKPTQEALEAAERDKKRNETQPGGAPKPKPKVETTAEKKTGDGGGGGGGGGD
jgi:hypothetical protein